MFAVHSIANLTVTGSEAKPYDSTHLPSFYTDVSLCGISCDTFRLVSTSTYLSVLLLCHYNGIVLAWGQPQRSTGYDNPILSGKPRFE